MRAIAKGTEPRSLAQHRATPHASYANYAAKSELRDSLVAEQRGLCCYCLSRIRIDAMKIEHWHSQSEHQGEELDYGNLLGACFGNEGQPKKHQHCDTRKGETPISRNPANPMHRIADLIRFESDGRISSDDETFDDELNRVLNLNEAFLKANRKATLDAFKDALIRRGNLTRPTVEKLLRHWNGELHTGALMPFSEIVVHWLRKRQARA